MGRAIDMENDIDVLKHQMSKVESELVELKATLSEILDAATTKKETKVETKKKKTNDDSSGKRSGKSSD
jgi:F0F1-type ATP synthase membrane subunit b/b'